MIYQPQEIHQASISYFQHLFTDSSPGSSVPTCFSFVNKFIQPDKFTELTRSVTAEEIKRTIFKMKLDKAPGLDGYTTFFFQQMWHIVGPDITFAVQSFFADGKLLKEINTTSLTLVPKIPNPSKLSEYRPISCCNLIYQIYCDPERKLTERD